MIEILNNIPNNYGEIKISSDIVKEFYFKLIEYRYKNILYPVYNMLNNLHRSDKVWN